MGVVDLGDMKAEENRVDLNFGWISAAAVRWKID